MMTQGFLHLDHIFPRALVVIRGCVFLAKILLLGAPLELGLEFGGAGLAFELVGVGDEVLGLFDESGVHSFGELEGKLGPGGGGAFGF